MTGKAQSPSRMRDDAAGAKRPARWTKDARLTPLRRRVLALIVQAGKPVKVLDLVDELQRAGCRLNKTSAFRAIEFLQTGGFLRRVNGLSAYIACDEATARPGPLYVCERCHAVQGAPATPVGDDPPEGFQVAWSITEHYGRCAACGASSSEVARG